MLILQRLNEDGMDRVFSGARSERVRLVVLVRIGALSYVNGHRLLEDACSRHAHSNRDLRRNGVGIANTEEDVRSRMVRLAPIYVNGRLFRDETDRATAPRNDHNEACRRASARRFRAVFLCEFSRVSTVLIG